MLCECESPLLSSRHIFFLLPLHLYSGNIHLVSFSLPLSPSLLFCFTPSLSLSPSLSVSHCNTPTQTVISALTLWLSQLVSQCLWSVSKGEDQTALSGNLNSVCFFPSHALSLSLFAPHSPYPFLPAFLSYFDPSNPFNLPRFTFSFPHHYFSVLVSHSKQAS